MFLKIKVGLNFPLEDMKEFVTGTAQRNIPQQAEVLQPGVVIGKQLAQAGWQSR